MRSSVVWSVEFWNKDQWGLECGDDRMWSSVVELECGAV